MAYYEKNEQNGLYSQIVARAWSDQAFKEALSKNPAGVLKKEYGIDVPADINLQVRENTDKVFHIVVDSAPASNEARMEVDKLAASSTFGSAGTLGTAGSACGTFGSVACLGTAGSWDI